MKILLTCLFLAVADPHQAVLITETVL